MQIFPQLVRHILNLASSGWLDEYGLTWLIGLERKISELVHYSAAELQNLIEAANKVCEGKSGPVLTLLKAPTFDRSRKGFCRIKGKYRKLLILLVGRVGIEPTTY